MTNTAALLLLATVALASVGNGCSVYAVMYGLHTCPYCKMFKSVLEEVLPGCHVFLDLELNETARREFLRYWEQVVGPAVSPRVPFTLIYVYGELKAYIVGALDAASLRRVLAEVEASNATLVCGLRGCKPLEAGGAKGAAVSVQPVAIHMLTVLGAIVFLALLDSVNPCFLAFYALTVTVAARRGRVASVAAPLVAGVFTGYLLLGLGIVTALTAYGEVVKKALAAAVLGLAVAHAYSALRPRERGCRICLYADKAARLAPPLLYLLGLAFSLTLLPCTAGPYAAAIALIAGLDRSLHIPLLILYNLVFISPLIAAALGAKHFTVKSTRRFDAIVAGLLAAIGLYTLLAA